MNRKGFTLVELLATLVVLGIVTAITVVSINGVFNSAKSKSEDVFVDTIEDAMEMYLSTDAKELEFTSDKNDDGLVDGVSCSNDLVKSFGKRKVYMVYTNFDKVMNSKYKPITQNDLVNPANEDEKCDLGEDIVVSIYRDEDFVYYYSISKSSFGCLLNKGTITNLPKVDTDGNGVIDDEDGYFTC